MTNNEGERLRKRVSSVFAVTGWIEKSGLRREPAQEQYSMAVCDWLCGNGDQPVGLIECETGVGKSLGYLIPLMFYLAMTGKRAAVATYTVALQDQLIRDDLVKVQALMRAKKLPSVSYVQRVGRRHYVDRDRVEVAIASLAGVGSTDNLRRFQQWADKTSQKGKGRLNEWLETYGPLPEGIEPSDICLNASSESENAGYRDDLQRCGNAQLVITSHSVLLQNLKRRGKTADVDLSFDAIVIDEADRVEDAARSLFDGRIRPQQITRLCERLAALKRPGLRRRLSALMAVVTDLEREMEALGRRVYPTSMVRDSQEFRAKNAALWKCVKAAQKTAAGVGSIMQTYPLAQGADFQAGELLAEQINWLRLFGGPESKHQCYGVAWSTVKRIASLYSTRERPAAVVSTYWNHLESRVMLTSATLSNYDTLGSSFAFSEITRVCAIEKDHVCVAGKFAPKAFGKCNFVLMSDLSPKPITHGLKDAENERALDSGWLSNAAEMCVTALAAGPTLILVRSFEELEALADVIGPSLIVQRRGVSLSECITKFRELKIGLITPSAWEGVNIRNSKGGQLFTQLVITRLPFAPPDNVRSENHVAQFREAFPNATRKNAESALYIQDAGAAIVRMRQGLGRAIRSKSDTTTVWIADPRFPKPEDHSSSYAYFRYCISERFKRSYYKACIFEPGVGVSPVVTQKTKILL